MSKKHQQRTRAEILAKRERPIPEISQNRYQLTGMPVPTQKPQSRSKYMPHFGKKQAAKLARKVGELIAA